MKKTLFGYEIGVGLVSLAAAAATVGIIWKVLSARKNQKVDGIELPETINNAVELVRIDATQPGHPTGPNGETSVASIYDFAPYKAIEPVDDLKGLVLDPNVSVYTFDPPRRIVILTRAPIHGSSAFVYQNQRNQATQVYAVPFDTYFEIIESNFSQVKFDNVVFLHSTGRCGSTLLSRLLDSSGSIISLSEPDTYTRMSVAMSVKTMTEKDAVRMIRASSRHLLSNILSPTKSDQTPPTLLFVKTRSFVMQWAHIIKEALPDIQEVFLYRAAAPTVESFAMAFLRGPIPSLLRKLGLDGLLLKMTWVQEAIPVGAPEYNNPIYPQNILRRLGLSGFAFMQWMSVMTQATRYKFDALLRYEELVQYKETLAQALLNRLNVKTKVKVDRTTANRVFSEDAHGELTTRSERKMDDQQRQQFQFLSQRDLEDMRLLASKNTYVQDVNPILPDTLMTSKST